MKIGNQTFVCSCGCYTLDSMFTHAAVKCRRCGRVVSEKLIFDACRAKTPNQQTLRDAFYTYPMFAVNAAGWSEYRPV